MTDEAYYAEVVDELARNGPRKGLWAKVFADAGGDENSAKAAYIKARVNELKAEKAENERAAQPPKDTEYAWIAWVIFILIFLYALFGALRTGAFT